MISVRYPESFVLGNNGKATCSPTSLNWSQKAQLTAAQLWFDGADLALGQFKRGSQTRVEAYSFGNCTRKLTKPGWSAGNTQVSRLVHGRAILISL